MKFYPKKILKIAFVALFALCLTLLSFLFLFKPDKVSADYAYSSLLPLKNEEYYALNSPINAYSDDEITAITNTDKQLIMFKQNGDFETITSTTPLKQVMRLNSEYLLFSDNLTVTAINVSDNSKTKLSYTDGNHEIKDLNNVFFDVALTENGFVIATTNNQKLQLFYIDDALNVSLLPYFLPNGDIPAGDIPASDAPVAVNSESVFYVSGNQIHSKSINKLDSTEDYISVTPNYMIADDSNVYYINDNKIYRISISDKSVTLLNFADNDNYELGKVNLPTSLSFKNGNLLITDNSESGSVQEFKINGDTLEFTGYAVASGLTAYNRAAASATDIERYGKFVAALDENKLTVIDTESYADYNRAAFINKFVGNAPDKFALGNGTILCSKGTSVYISDVLEDTKKQITGLPSGAPQDISYQSGNYYITYLDIGTNSKIVKIAENGEVLSETNFNGVAANAVCVDVFGNAYVADGENVYKNEAETVYPLAGANKLATDLAGNLFALSNGKIYKLGGTADAFEEVFATADAIKSFGLNFDKSEVYFITEDKEEIFRTVLDNVSLKDFGVNAEFTAATASKRELKVYTAENAANAYSVSQKGDGFEFNGLIDKVAEYHFVAEINAGGITLCALASNDGVVLIDERHLTEKSVGFTAAPEKAFLTTDVCAYAIPVIEKRGLFAMNKDGNIRLKKGAVIYPKKAFTLLDKTFYDATATVNGEDIACYIPADFTATLMTETLEFENYTIEKVKKTALYKNADLTEELFMLDEGETVKVLENDGGVLKVAAERADGVVIGYVSADALIVNPNHTVRNVLIILAVFGSLAGTISYFLLRKKR